VGRIHNFKHLFLRFYFFFQAFTGERKFFMEEQQIRSFVHSVLQDEKLRNELVNDPDAVIVREDFHRVCRAL
jgi:hypothetical protein